MHNTLEIAVYVFFLFNRTTLQVFVTYLTGALYVHPLWFYKHQHCNQVCSKMFVACQRWWFQWWFWFVPLVPGYIGCTYRAPVRYVTKTWSVVLLYKKIHILLSQVYCVWHVVKTPTIISNNFVYCILIVWWPVTECRDILVGWTIHCIFTWWPDVYSVYWQNDDQLHGVSWHGRKSYTLCLEMVTSYTLCLDTVRPMILCILTWWPVICCVLTWWDQLYIVSWHGETSYTLYPDMVRPVILYIVSCHGDQLFVFHLYTRMTCYKMHIDSLVTSYLLCLVMVTSNTLCLDMVTSFLLCLDMMTSYLLSCHSDQLLVLYLYTAMTCYTMHCDSIVTKYSCLCCWQSLIICSCYQQIWNKFYCLYLTYKTVPRFVNRNVPDFELFQSFITSSDKSGWGHVADNRSLSTVLQLCRSLSAQTSSGFHWVRSIAFATCKCIVRILKWIVVPFVLWSYILITGFS